MQIIKGFFLNASVNNGMNSNTRIVPLLKSDKLNQKSQLPGQDDIDQVYIVETNAKSKNNNVRNSIFVTGGVIGGAKLLHKIFDNKNATVIEEQRRKILLKEQDERDNGISFSMSNFIKSFIENGLLLFNNEYAKNHLCESFCATTIRTSFQFLGDSHFNKLLSVMDVIKEYNQESNLSNTTVAKLQYSDYMKLFNMLKNKDHNKSQDIILGSQKIATETIATIVDLSQNLLNNTCDKNEDIIIDLLKIILKDIINTSKIENLVTLVKKAFSDYKVLKDSGQRLITLFEQTMSKLDILIGNIKTISTSMIISEFQEIMQLIPLFISEFITSFDEIFIEFNTKASSLMSEFKSMIEFVYGGVMFVLLTLSDFSMKTIDIIKIIKQTVQSNVTNKYVESLTIAEFFDEVSDYLYRPKFISLLVNNLILIVFQCFSEYASHIQKIYQTIQNGMVVFSILQEYINKSTITEQNMIIILDIFFDLDTIELRNQYLERFRKILHSIENLKIYHKNPNQLSGELLQIMEISNLFNLLGFTNFSKLFSIIFCFEYYNRSKEDRKQISEDEQVKKYLQEISNEVDKVLKEFIQSNSSIKEIKDYLIRAIDILSNVQSSMIVGNLLTSITEIGLGIVKSYITSYLNNSLGAVSGTFFMILSRNIKSSSEFKKMEKDIENIINEEVIKILNDVSKILQNILDFMSSDTYSIDFLIESLMQFFNTVNNMNTDNKNENKNEMQSRNNLPLPITA